MIRVLVVDDLPSVRKAICMRIAAEPDIAVVGEAPDGEVALVMANSVCPDIVLMDVEMPLMDGVATTRALRLIRPESAVIMLSIHDDAFTRARAERAGAAAFVSRSTWPDMLPTTIRQVFQARSGSGKGEHNTRAP
jgi:DNA-binding NarL/FixJ family response regulator